MSEHPSRRASPCLRRSPGPWLPSTLDSCGTCPASGSCLPSTPSSASSWRSSCWRRRRCWPGRRHVRSGGRAGRARDVADCSRLGRRRAGPLHGLCQRRIGEPLGLECRDLASRSFAAGCGFAGRGRKRPPTERKGDHASKDPVEDHHWPRSGRIFDGYAPSGIRTRATTLKGWRPRPLVDGGGGSRIAATRVYTGRSGPVAQLVEQGTFNPKVTGSIPVRPIPEVPGNWLLARRTSDVLPGLPVRIQYD